MMMLMKGVDNPIMSPTLSGASTPVVCQFAIHLPCEVNLALEAQSELNSGACTFV